MEKLPDWFDHSLTTNEGIMESCRLTGANHARDKVQRVV